MALLFARLVKKNVSLHFYRKHTKIVNMTDAERIKLLKYPFIHIKNGNLILKGVWENNQKVAIYYESSYNDATNNYIRKHYDEILSFYNGWGIAFIYFPMLLENLEDSIRYNYPDSTRTAIDIFSTNDFYRVIKDNTINMPDTKYPMVLVSDPDKSIGISSETQNDDATSFYCYLIENERDILLQFRPNRYPKIFEHEDEAPFDKVEEDDILFRDGDEEQEVAPIDRADWGEIEILSYEIQKRIQRLYDMGVNERIIRQIVAIPEPKLSPLIITDNFQIILPDYNDMEIAMPVLSKTVYFFYLRHEEGVLFKHLSNYRSELYNIYCTISPREDTNKLSYSINDITDSTKNSINEKCSRIKTAFASQFQDKLACQYYITGRAGEPKHISLDRSLVTDNSGLIMHKLPT